MNKGVNGQTPFQNVLSFQSFKKKHSNLYAISPLKEGAEEFKEVEEIRNLTNRSRGKPSS